MGYSPFLLCTLAVNAPLIFFMKRLVQRARPFVPLPGVRAACESPRGFSFPSGHAAESFAFAVFVATACVFAAPRSASRFFVAAAALAVATGVAVFRVYLGVHFPADVTFGAVVGAAVGHVGGRLYLADRRRTQGATARPSAIVRGCTSRYASRPARRRQSSPVEPRAFTRAAADSSSPRRRRSLPPECVRR